MASFFGEFAYHVEVELSKKNYKLLLCNISGPKRELDYLTMLQQNKVDGIIAITYSPIEDYLSSNIPFVSIDRVYENKDIACVSSDNRAGAELAANTLIAKVVVILPLSVGTIKPSTKPRSVDCILKSGF